MQPSLKFFVSTISIICFIACGQNDTKNKELELKERELALREKELELKQSDSIKQTHNSNSDQKDTSKQPMSESASMDKGLSDQEYGKYNFTIPTGSRAYWITISLIRGTNKAILTDAGYSGGEVIEGKDNGTFVVDKVNSEFKYITCKFKKQGIYKLKYSTKKKKLILLNITDPLGNEIESD